MLNNQKRYYKSYYVMFPNGDQIKVDRATCFAPAEPITETNPYPQRWYYSPDGECAIRLPRTAKGMEIARMNRADIKQAERLKLRDIERGHISLDKYINKDDGDDDFEHSGIPDPNADVEKNYITAETACEVRSLVEELNDAVSRQVCELIMEGKSYAYIARVIGTTEKAVRYRLKHLSKIFSRIF